MEDPKDNRVDDTIEFMTAQTSIKSAYFSYVKEMSRIPKDQLYSVYGFKSVGDAAENAFHYYESKLNMLTKDYLKKYPD